VRQAASLTPMDTSSLSLLELGRSLARARFRFVTPTPETHRRVIARREQARDLRDVFGWSLPFARELLPPALFDLLDAAGCCSEEGSLFRSRVRFSSLQDALYVHSAYPTKAAESVFFGPDTYRFCAFIARSSASLRGGRVVDIGCGSGAGGLVAARVTQARELVLADINAAALALAEVNARLAEREAVLMQSDVLASVEGQFDLIVANPPYMRDPGERVYRDGGGEFGEALSVRILREGLTRLAPGGTLLLYTGAAVVAGEDVFASAAHPLLQGFSCHYEELDPDVFGEELERPGYERVERIAAVGLRAQRAT
jgi:SAM-dependent methyltransferase